MSASSSGILNSEKDEENLQILNEKDSTDLKKHELAYPQHP